MTWEEINNKRLPFIRFGENLFKRMYGEIRREFVSSIQNLTTPEEFTQAAQSFRIDDSIVKINIERFYIKTGVAFAKAQVKSLRGGMELKQEEDWEIIIREFIRTRTGKKISQVIQSETDDIIRITKKVVQQGIDEGWGMDKIARAIQKTQAEMDLWKALRIARTEVVTASNIGVKVGADELPGNKVKVWISTFDQRSRPEHMAMDGVRVAMNEMFNVNGEMMEFPGDPNASAGNIINCYTGDMEIKSAIIAAQKSFYSGKIREIITRGGKRITITPNHNILTIKGFIRAKDICIGDDLICNSEEIKRTSVILGGRQYINDKKAFAENIFDSLLGFWKSKSTPVTHLDFNNDGKFMKENITIINGNWILPGDRKFFIKDFGKFRFKHSRAKTSLIKSFCSLHFGLNRVFSSSNSLVGFLYLAFPFIRRHIVPFNLFTFGLSSHHYPILNEFTLNSGSVTREYLRQLVKTYSRHIHLDSVLHVRDIDFSGHVYDFTSLSGTNIVNNIYTSNCRCGYEILVTPEIY